MKFDMISLKENLRVLPKENKLNMSFWFQHSFFLNEAFNFPCHNNKTWIFTLQLSNSVESQIFKSGLQYSKFAVWSK